MEACITRNLLDTSAYFWPGFMNPIVDQVPLSVPNQVPGWSSFMKGSPLTPLVINALVSAPASRYPYVFIFEVLMFCLTYSMLRLRELDLNQASEPVI